MLGGLVTNIIKNKKTLNKLQAGYNIKNQHDKGNKSNKKSVVQNNYKEIGNAIKANKLSASEVVNAMKPGGFLDYTYLLSNKNDLKGFKRSFLTFSKTKDYSNLVKFLTDLQDKINDTEIKKSIKQIIGLLERSIEFKKAKKVLTKKDDFPIGDYRGLNKDEIQILRSITRASKKVSFKGCHTIGELNNRFKEFVVDLLTNIIKAKTFFDSSMYYIPEEWEKALKDVENDDFEFVFKTTLIKDTHLSKITYGHDIPTEIANIITSAITVLTNSKDKYKTYVNILNKKKSIEQQISNSFDQIFEAIDYHKSTYTAEYIINLFLNDKTIYKYCRLFEIIGYNKLKQAVANSKFTEKTDIEALTTFQKEIKNIELKSKDSDLKSKDSDNEVVKKFNEFKEKFLNFKIQK